MDLAGQPFDSAHGRGNRGYAMAALLVGMSVMAVLMGALLPVWTHMATREKEAELIFRGNQYARAIGLFQRKFANTPPPTIDVLVEQRFLRKKYKDPITNDDFQPIYANQADARRHGAWRRATAGPAAVQREHACAPADQLHSAGFNSTGATAAGGIIGVTSKSKDASIKIFNGRQKYNEWAFVHVQTAQRPGQPGRRRSNAGYAGRRRISGRAGQQPGSPFGMQPGGRGCGNPNRRPGCRRRRQVSAEPPADPVRAAIHRLATANPGSPRQPSTPASGRRGSGRQVSNDRVVQRAAHVLNPLAVSRRMHAIRQDHHIEIFRRIDPQRRAGETGVTDRAAPTASCRTTRSAASCPTPSARELPGTAIFVANSDSAGDAHPPPRARADRGRGAEQSRVRGHAAKRRGVLVVHLAAPLLAEPACSRSARCGRATAGPGDSAARHRRPVRDRATRRTADRAARRRRSRARSPAA